MDSLSQILLGAWVAELLAGKQYWNKALIAGALLGTLLDLDVFLWPLLFTDTLHQEFFHRTITHSLLFGVGAAPFFGRLLSRISKNAGTFRLRTRIAFWCFRTHALLDRCTGYWTQLLRPFSQTYFAIDSVFIIDPLYTVPLLLCLVITARYRRTNTHRKRYALIGLIVSTTYLLRGVVAQQIATTTAAWQVPTTVTEPSPLHASPELFTTFLRRVLAEDDQHRYITRRSLFDHTDTLQRKKIPKQHGLLEPYMHDTATQRLKQRRPLYRVASTNDTSTVLFIPMSFGDIIGRTTQTHTYLMAYTLTIDTTGAITVTMPDTPSFQQPVSVILEERWKRVQWNT